MPLGVVLNGLVEIDLILRVLGSNLSLEGLFEVGLLQENADHDKELFDGQLRAPGIMPVITYLTSDGIDVRMVDGSLEDNLR